MPQLFSGWFYRRSHSISETMDSEQQLSNLVKWKKARPSNISLLGDTVREIMDGRLTAMHERFEMVAGVWNQLLPCELGCHCKIVEITGGQLKVQVDSPAYLHELRMCSSQLLTELQQQCRHAKIKNIKFVIG